MTKTQKENYATTLDQFSRESGKTVQELIPILDKLHRYETTLNRINEIACDRDLTPPEERRYENTTQKVETLVHELGFQVKFNGDPRGAAIKIKLPSRRYNSWDGESWVIDW